MGTQPSPVRLSKDSGTQPQSSLLELGVLHTTTPTLMQMQATEGTDLDLQWHLKAP